MTLKIEEAETTQKLGQPRKTIVDEVTKTETHFMGVVPDLDRFKRSPLIGFTENTRIEINVINDEYRENGSEPMCVYRITTSRNNSRDWLVKAHWDYQEDIELAGGDTHRRAAEILKSAKEAYQSNFE